MIGQLNFTASNEPDILDQQLFCHR